MKFDAKADVKGLFTPSVSINAVMTLVILFSLKTVELLENGLQLILERLHCFQLVVATSTLAVGVNGP